MSFPSLVRGHSSRIIGSLPYVTDIKSVRREREREREREKENETFGLGHGDNQDDDGNFFSFNRFLFLRSSEIWHLNLFVMSWDRERKDAWITGQAVETQEEFFFFWSVDNRTGMLNDCFIFFFEVKSLAMSYTFVLGKYLARSRIGRVSWIEF